MSFQDIFNAGFLEGVSSLSVVDISITLILSFVVGLFIYQVYKNSYQSVVYTKSFSVSLVMMTMVTSLVILAVTANVVLSLGMVGALSIVRFRAAIKDPMDIVFMFWSIAVGIVIGAGFYLLAIIGSIVIGAMIILLNMNVVTAKPYLLVLSAENHDVEKLALDKIKSSVGKYQVKTKTVRSDIVELMIELRVKEDQMGLINKLLEINGILQASLISSHEYSV
ncbi:DUF4956 domain-containing protein [Acidaminobacter sp. JC074]|uniref:DUF4956 domain-containing protein n=1 Tax=Acidaminobacter sp. JC074 TaxID=2530199 RepID=UPI001F0E3943|nr:DUF4956 domain-containing protein [Acidaminobacter sp. JC074]MCH4888137.1 DUF4956 domain-containing protein [Acidaminobacter sp. JC074]